MPLRGTIADGKAFTGHLLGGDIEMQIGSVWCRGRYNHWLGRGHGTLKCTNGREGDFSMRSSPEVRFGPGHGEGEATGTLDGRPFRFSYGSVGQELQE